MFAGLTVREHLILAHRVHVDRRRLWRDMFTGAGWLRSGPAEVRRIDELLELLSLTEVADTPVDPLPLGTARLVEVGRALATDPKVVLLDEPLSGLDANEATHLAAALRRTVTERGTALLLVEHDVAMVLSLCSHIVVLDFGEVISQGPPDVIRDDPKVKVAYLGDELTPGQAPARDAGGRKD
jgi:ABC-type branched-subunit amino acid transport system ATPase component